MFIRKHFVTSLACLIFLTLITFAQDRSLISPQKLDGLETRKVNLPMDLNVLDACSFDYSIKAFPKPSGLGFTTRTSVTLYNTKGGNIGKFEMEEGLPNRDISITYSDQTDSASVRISLIRNSRETKLEISTGDGRSVSTLVKTGTKDNPDSLRVQTLSLLGPESLEPLETVVDFENPVGRLKLQRAIQTEEDKLFSTNGLLKLREVMRNIVRMGELAFSNGLTARTLKPTASLGAECNPNPLMLMAPCSGSAYCVRVSTVIPIFTCIGGGVGCNGYYLIPDDILVVLPIIHTCAYLNQCA